VRACGIAAEYQLKKVDSHGAASAAEVMNVD
jgi:hypothetical protein